ncbi:S10 family peptidase [Gaopeijia maritima]|uniref:S10 family peptidase n=1 Tax=Gaopeijia maritima TaxID=3119007 RepID=UPI00326E9D1E
MRSLLLRLRAGAVALAALAPASGAAQVAPDFNADTAVVTTHSVTIGGTSVPYTAEVGYLPVMEDDGTVLAALFYTWYERTDVDDKVSRPLVVSFNGGPGSGSLWMHIGYTGPRMLEIDDEGYPIMPYGMRDNPHSILDVADIVYVNPVNVGYSRIVGDAERSRFFGVNEDIRYLSDWIRTFVTRKGRWASPKYLIGESYGTTRASGLARELQNSEWMYLNGVILVSPTGLGVERAGPVGDALALPNYTATAWYHGQLDSDLQSRPIVDVLAEVEEYTLDRLLPALARGGSLTEAERREVATEVARWSGTSPEWVLAHNLRPNVGEFRKELLRDEGFTVGRLDARYKGRDRRDAGQGYDYDPALAAWNHAFSPAINIYMSEELGWSTDLQYFLFGPVNPWNRNGDDTGEDLRQAMSENPYLHLLVQGGYYDGGTDYFSAKYTMWNLDPAGRLQDRMRFTGYESGHMMYLRADDLPTSNQDIRDFILWSLEATQGAARYR